MVPPVLQQLGALGVRRFLREYWQRRPLLVRQAVPGLAAPLTRDELFALAGREDVESRLVERTGRHWALRHGPFTRRALPPLSRARWTLLVQGVDLVDERAHAWLSRFRFVPDTRLDDLMVSYASHGGGVGPHRDNYDVFLLQVAGRRRWRISHQRELPLVRGQPLPVLAGFRATQEWVLEPGDMLYLPPGVVHDGVAIGASLACSVGFRTPTWAELLDPWLARFAARHELPGRYADRDLQPARHPATLPEAMVRQVHAALSRARPGITDTRQFLLEHLSEPKPHVVFNRPARALGPDAFLRQAARRGLALDLRSRMLMAGRLTAINGELVAAPRGAHRTMQRLADARRLTAAEVSAASPAVLALLQEWHAAGWLRLGPAPRGARSPRR